MNPSSKCRAKDPTKCWKHGNQQGVHTFHVIQKALAPGIVHTYQVKNVVERPLKQMDGPRLAISILSATKKIGVDEGAMRSCIVLAAELHQHDLRQSRNSASGQQPYIEHPLRNTLRLIRLGVTDQPTLLSSVLHDTVEDHPFELAAKNGLHTENENKARAAAYSYITEQFGAETATVVEGMSNPISVDKYMPAAEKNKIYAQHVEEAIENPKVFASKIADFIDNAVGLYHNRATMSPVGLRKRATKYLGVVDILDARLKKGVIVGDLPLSSEGCAHVAGQLSLGRERLTRLKEEFAA